MASLNRRPLPAWLRRILLVSLGTAFALALVALTELGLRLAGVGRDLSLFIPDTERGYHRTNPDFTSIFTPASFGLQPAPFRIAEKKPAGVKRIFVVGESAVMGVPSPEFGIVPQLRAILRHQLPTVPVEVYNVGITAINSHVLLWAVRDLAAFEPDLVILYVGNNEIVGPYGPGSFYASQTPPLWLARLSAGIRRTRLGQLVSRLAPAEKRDQRWAGMQMFTENRVAPNDPRLPRVYDNFRSNLQAMAADARSSGAEVILSTVVGNLKDCAPFVSTQRPDLSEADRKRWQSLSNEGTAAWRLGKVDAAEARLLEARKIDPTHAATWWVLGRLALARGDVREARRCLREAMHHDALRFRPDLEINQAVRSVAQADSRIRFVDTAVSLGYEGDSGDSLPGSEILYEHVHFNLEGARRVAALLADAATPLLARGGTAASEPSPEQVAAAVGWNPFAAHRTFRAIHAQNSLAPFTGQLTFIEDTWNRQRALDALLAPALDPLTGKPATAVIDASLAQLSHAIENDPDNPDLLRLRLELLLLAERPAAALPALESWEKRVPQTTGAALQRAQVLAVNGRGAEAIRVLRNASLQERGTVLATEALAQTLSENGQSSEARSLLSERIAQGKADPKLVRLYADLCAAGGDPTGARRVLEQHLERDPTDTASLEQLCRLLESAGDTAAVKAWRLRLAESQTSNLTNTLFVAEARKAEGNVVEAERFLRLACDTGQADSTAFLLRAQGLSEQNDPANTLVNLLRARVRAEAAGNRAAVREISGLIRYYQGQLPF
ncbi:tetratricopeptide repeat protein [Nibricoccus sp. IMCC34717]|uniref:tetratricopeptide repeat protein n=1 Tax=Nibricoccus sp. IMCC34717 TaxID=3034021 RepID=UPI00384E9273